VGERRKKNICDLEKWEEVFLKILPGKAWGGEKGIKSIINFSKGRGEVLLCDHTLRKGGKHSPSLFQTSKLHSSSGKGRKYSSPEKKQSIHC